MSRNQGGIGLTGLLTAFFCLSAGLAAQPPGGRTLPDPPPEEIAQDLKKRTSEWRKLQAQVSRKKDKAWKVRTAGRLVVVVSAGVGSSRNVTHMITMASAMRKWLDRHFRLRGAAKVPPAVIRVCATSQETSTWRRGSRHAFVWRTGEIVLTYGIGSALDGAFSQLGRGLTEHYLDHQRPGLWEALPEWLARGLPAHLKGARLRKKLGFFFVAPRGSWRQAMALLRRKTFLPSLDLVSTPHGELVQVRRNSLGDCKVASELLVRYVTFGRGRKGRTKGFIAGQLGQLQADLERLELEGWKAVMKQEALAEKRPDAATRRRNFEEFQERMRNWKRLPEERRRAIQSAAFKAAFGAWKPEHWRAVDKSFRAWIRNGLR